VVAPEHGEVAGLGGRSGGLMPYYKPAALSADWWRRGGFWFAQPGGVLARVSEEYVCGGGGV
jgi:hypothetical protein